MTVLLVAGVWCAVIGVLILVWANTPHARARRRDTRIPAARPRHYKPGWQPWQDDDRD